MNNAEKVGLDGDGLKPTACLFCYFNPGTGKTPGGDVSGYAGPCYPGGDQPMTCAAARVH
jgi:hypothetical protein